MDPYAGAVSDVYQDLFGEGSFTGKGIYDVDAFEAALEGKVPENALLSHDLFEGSFARAGLATDVDLFEDFPTNYEVAARRLHRWVRGDWQLLPGSWARRATPRGKSRALASPPEADGRWWTISAAVSSHRSRFWSRWPAGYCLPFRPSSGPACLSEPLLCRPSSRSLTAFSHSDGGSRSEAICEP